MPRKAKELTDMAVRNLREPGLHFVGEVPGLALQVLPTGARTWVLRASVGGRRREMGLGGYPEVTLKAAREAARRAREKIRGGVDPIAERRSARSALAASLGRDIAFRQLAEQFILEREAGWENPKHRQQWRNTLATYAYPVIGHLQPAHIDVDHLERILKPLWADKPETAKRLRARIENVLDFAVAKRLREGDNPARESGPLRHLLGPQQRRVKHHRALAVGEAGAFMARLRSAEGMGARALEFAILTAARSKEVRGASWSEIDLDARLWTVPAGRMKMRREHRVPLSDAAVALLQALPRMGDSDLVFSAPRGGQLSDMTLSAVLRRMKVDAVPHGFRSTFRDWTAERTAYPHEVAEMALAHTVGNKVEAAYRRGDLFEKRRRLMDDWAAFLAQPERSAGVVPLRGAAVA